MKAHGDDVGNERGFRTPRFPVCLAEPCGGVLVIPRDVRARVPHGAVEEGNLVRVSASKNGLTLVGEEGGGS